MSRPSQSKNWTGTTVRNEKITGTIKGTGQNVGVAGIPFFTPAHNVSPGSPYNSAAPNIPTLFTPLEIRGVTARNRIMVAPMCQFSAAPDGPQIGMLTPYHIATLGHYALKGAGTVFIEATGVQPNGRISPNCPGIWCDEQIPSFRVVADFVRSQGALCALQLAHAGRKASCAASFVAIGQRKASVRAGKEAGGWPENVVAPSGGEEFTWDGKSGTDPTGGFNTPRELSTSEVEEMVEDWAKAAIRGVKAGVDILEIHAAHGYLIHQFLSPITNHRQDKYGGSFDNRIRLLLEIIKAIRVAIPESMPLFLRISATEWMEGTEIGKSRGSWDVDSSIRLAKIVARLGVDLLDVSSGGNHPLQKINVWDTKDYQTKIAAQIRDEVLRDGHNLLIGAVGLITEAEQARDIVQTKNVTTSILHGASSADDTVRNDVSIKEEAQIAKEMTEAEDGKQPMADAVLVARQFMREPEWVLKVAAQLGLDVAWPVQFNRVRLFKI